MDPSLGHVREQLLVFGLTITVMGFGVDGSIGLLSGRLSALLRRSRRVARGLNVFSGTIFTGLAVPLAVTPKERHARGRRPDVNHRLTVKGCQPTVDT